MFPRSILLALLIAVGALGFGPECRAEPAFIGLGDFPGGDHLSVAYAVSGDGTTVVGRGTSVLSRPVAFRWTLDGGMESLGGLPGGASMSTAGAVSTDGSTIVGWGDSSLQNEAFVWSREGGMLGIGAFPSAKYSKATGVSADGSVVIGLSLGTGHAEAFRWTSGGGMVGLGYLPSGLASDARGISADGEMIVGYAWVDIEWWGGPVPFTWNGTDGMASLGDLTPEVEEFDGSGAHAISADGSTVVGYSHNGLGHEAFSSTAPGGMVGIGDLPGGQFVSQANATSADGSIIVGFSEGPLGDQAFIWDTENGMRSVEDVLADLGLDLTGWALTAAHGISGDGGVIVGSGLNPNGDVEAWVAILEESATPVFGLGPAAAALLSSLLGASGLRRLGYRGVSVHR